MSPSQSVDSLSLSRERHKYNKPIDIGGGPRVDRSPPSVLPYPTCRVRLPSNRVSVYRRRDRTAYRVRTALGRSLRTYDRPRERKSMRSGDDAGCIGRSATITVNGILRRRIRTGRVVVLFPLFFPRFRPTGNGRAEMAARAP